MQVTWTSVVLAAWLLSTVQAEAFEQCPQFFSDPDGLQTFVEERGVQDAPVKYFDKARAIRVDTRQSDRLIPRATFDPQGKPVIMYPAEFPPVLCRVALATFMAIENGREPMDEETKAAGACLLAGRSERDCLRDYAQVLEQRYQASFASMDWRKQQLAYTLATHALSQLAKHEYAHHLLDHFNRVPSAIARIDAEFEADFYAILNGVQMGEAPPAMGYFFKEMAEMERQSEGLASRDYESSACRATNVADISDALGIAPMLLLDRVSDEGKFHNRDLTLGKVSDELEQSGEPSVSPDSCGRLAQTVLRKARAELLTLTRLVAPYEALLVRRTAEQGDSAGGLGLNAPQIFTLIDQVQGASRGMVHLKGLAVGTLAMLIRRVSLDGGEDAVSRQLDDIIQSLAVDIVSADYGRLLGVRALTALYGARDQPLAPRLDSAEPMFRKAVTFLPALSEAWMNLAMIALVRGDCGKAAELEDKAAHTAEESGRANLEDLRDALLRANADPDACAKLARLFATHFAR